MSMKRKKVGHEQGLSVQLSMVGHFFPRRHPPKRNCLAHLWYLQAFHKTAYQLLQKIVFCESRVLLEAVCPLSSS